VKTERKRNLLQYGGGIFSLNFCPYGQDECTWKSDVPTILSVCLVSMEPDGVLRVMSDQYTPDERFGGSAAQCALSTPRDATATHILVFPTSATAQVNILV
jgi:hypothetical protein